LNHVASDINICAFKLTGQSSTALHAVTVTSDINICAFRLTGQSSTALRAVTVTLHTKMGDDIIKQVVIRRANLTKENNNLYEPCWYVPVVFSSERMPMTKNVMVRLQIEDWS